MRRFVRRVSGLLLGCAALAPAGLHAQAATDLFLVELSRAEGALRTGAVTRLTNRDGYDNQPQFTADGRAVLYTTIDAAGQADIARIDLDGLRSTRVTRSAPESEYSATPMPGGERMSVIRVEADSTQRLWSFTLDGADPRVVLENVAPVGYHAWLGERRLGLFVLGDPATLQLADVTTGEARIIARDIGRSLHRIPGTGTLSYVQRDGGGTGRIRAYDPATGQSRDLVDEVPENEFHAWMPDGALLGASGSRLLMWREGDASWTQVADLVDAGISAISRLAVSPDGTRLVVVAAHR